MGVERAGYSGEEGRTRVVGKPCCMLFVVVSQNSIFLVGSRDPRAPLQDRSSQDGGLIGKLLDKCLQGFFRRFLVSANARRRENPEVYWHIWIVLSAEME